MTLQEAQTKFSKIIGRISPTMTSSELVQIQEELYRLLASLPNTSEFDGLVAAIADLSPKLTGHVTQAVIQDIAARDAALTGVMAQIDRIAKEAQAAASRTQVPQLPSNAEFAESADADQVLVHERAEQLLPAVAQESQSRGAGLDDASSLSSRVSRQADAGADTGANGLTPVNPDHHATAPTTKGALYPVWFGTNRKPKSDGKGFTAERHDQTTRGRVDVLIPKSHRFGETGNPFWKRLLRFGLRDDHLRVQRVEQQERDAFFAEIHAAMQAARESWEKPHALFFLHGFNVTFEEAAIRAAQIGFDLKVPGATAFFSWPSRGAVAAYPADEATIEASEQAITDFLADFVANCGAEQIHVIAHSMGNRGLLRALQRIAANAEMRGKVKFGQIFLAAPDVDRDLFLNLASLYSDHSERTTLYVSRADLPVHLSAKFHDAPRAGYYEPYTVAPRMDTVAVPDFDVDILGHAYFAKAEPLLYDIRELMLHNDDPRTRQRIDTQPLIVDGNPVWKMRK